MFSQYSHEFQTITEAGEDTIYVDRKKRIAINEEVNNDEVLENLGLKREDLEEVRAAEVGNIFTLNDKFSKPLELGFIDEEGASKNVLMGCYGIGPSRLVGVITELYGDDRGLVWPENIAPFKVYLAQLGEDEGVIKASEELYQSLTQAGITVLYDDRDLRPGEKFADADLMGIPYRLVVSQKTVEAGKYELKKRGEWEVEMLSSDDLLNKLS